MPQAPPPVHPSRSTSPSRRRCVAAAALVGALFAAGCASDEDSATSDVFDAPAATEAPAELADTDGGAEAGGAEAPAQGGSGSASVAIDAGRSVIRTASITVEVGDIEGGADGVATIARGQGGDVADAELVLDGERRASMTVRVPPGSMSQTVAEIGALGRVLGRSQDAQDVTAAVVDLDARISSAEASVTRVRDFLARATKVSELAELEQELTARETALEQLLAQQRTLSDQVDLATVHVVLTEALVDEPAAVSLAGALETDTPRIAAAFVGGVDALWSAVQAAATALAAALPFLLVALVLAWPIRRIWARLRSQRGVTPPEHPAP